MVSVLLGLRIDFFDRFGVGAGIDLVTPALPSFDQVSPLMPIFDKNNIAINGLLANAKDKHGFTAKPYLGSTAYVSAGTL